MSVALTYLVTRLQADVPARNNVPSGDQYIQAVKDAVDDYSNRNPRRKRTTLAMVSGTDTYDLPADFVRAITLNPMLATEGVLVTDNGLIPVSASYEEEYTIAGGQITFYPTPGYTTSRYLWYAAGHVLDDADNYPEMTRDEARVIHLKAQSIALQMQANKTAQEAWQYAIGDERVSKEKLADSLGKQASQMQQDYLAAVEEQVGPVGMRPG